jgi:hypothetical protein
MKEWKVTAKRRIAPVTITLVVKAGRINENGTFSSFEVISAKGANSTLKASVPPQGGGAIYLKVESLEGIKILADDDGPASAGPKPKLF